MGQAIDQTCMLYMVYSHNSYVNQCRQTLEHIYICMQTYTVTYVLHQYDNIHVFKCTEYMDPRNQL